MNCRADPSPAPAPASPGENHAEGRREGRLSPGEAGDRNPEEFRSKPAFYIGGLDNFLNQGQVELPSESAARGTTVRTAARRTARCGRHPDMIRRSPF
jgi:hypothetical protein